MQNIQRNIYVSPQVELIDLPTIKAKGITQIICHRPDGEELTQPSFEMIAAAATEQGIRCLYLPISGGVFPPEVIQETYNALMKDEATLMYCKSGMRSTVVWALGELAAGRDVNEIIQTQLWQVTI
ncbi:MAG: TIGR01244 family sulfur transferase [Cardiobacteriaceae bacterium]|nr:TIGR01244 family sulfur transferase [Cardiobacteriaceae bacterium]